MSTEPPRETTDPGLRQQDQHIGAHGELTLPDVVPIVHPAHSGRLGRWFNEQWIQAHFFMRGVVGTGSEWFTFLVGAASQYPKVSVILLAGCAMVAPPGACEHLVRTRLEIPAWLADEKEWR